MCGLVGLHLRDASLYPRLGCLMAEMLCQVTARGPDAAGVAVYGHPVRTPPQTGSVSILTGGTDPADIRTAVRAEVGLEVTVVPAGQTVVINARTSPQRLRSAVRSALPGAVVTGSGHEIAVLKGAGDPRRLIEEFRLRSVCGWQAVGHTRMATESAVTPSHSHPFSVAQDQCFVHNGSFANHATIRRELQADGAEFDSDNDSEVGARFVAAQLADGHDLEKALRLLCDRFDGFYTLLAATRDSFAVVRDAIACKPAIIAETPAWVAMASEYRALAGLPGIAEARLFEPEPEEVHVWRR